MKFNPLGLLLAVVVIPIAEASSCVCSWFPLAVGTKTITGSTVVTSTVFLAGTPLSEMNGNVLCQGTPPAPTKPPTKVCNTSFTGSMSLSVSVGANFGLDEWLTLGLTTTAGVSYTTACNASINNWCECCICVCTVPKTVTTATGFCTGSYVGTPYLCSSGITDTATAYGWMICTNTWDADRDGKEDCWNRMPKPCKTSCNTGS